MLAYYVKASHQQGQCFDSSAMGSTFFLLTLAALASLASSQRQGPLTDFYRELGCVPRFETPGPIPTSYDCASHEGRDLNKCQYQDKSFLPNENLGDLAPCSAACRCLKGGLGGSDKYPTITCAQVECPEDLGVRPSPGSYNVYEHDKCCAVKTVAPEKERVAPATCTHDGETYRAGQKFYPKEEPCKVCICGEGYQGKVEAPFCRDIKCNTQLRSLGDINEGCVPVYYGPEGCCPIEWKCPSATDKVNKNKTKIRVRTTEKCKFGQLELQPLESLERTVNSGNLNIDCTCQVPPFITCIASRSE